MVASRTRRAMHRRRNRLLLAAGLLGAALGAPASASAIEPTAGRPATRLLAVGAEDAGAGARIRVLADGALGRVDVFALHDPERLVIDLYGLRDGETPPSVEVGGARFARMRVGRHPEKIRIVVDPGASPPALESHTTRLQPDGLVLSFGIEENPGEGEPGALERSPLPTTGAAFAPRVDLSPWRVGAARIERFGSYPRVDPPFEWSEQPFSVWLGASRATVDAANPGELGAET